MEKYYWNGEEYTWKQLLFAFHQYIESRALNSWVNWNRIHKEYNRLDIDVFFSDFRHCQNDTRITYDWNGTKIVSQPTNIVWDSYDRIISSGYLKQEFIKYVPNELDRKPRKIKGTYWKRWHVPNTFEFRKDPVPFTKKRKKGSWEKYDGTHSRNAPELRKYYACKVDFKEIKKEYGIDIRLRRNISDLDPYEWEYRHNKGRGWKRSRKEKQWMKFSWKKVYSKFPEEEIYVSTCINIYKSSLKIG